MVCVAEVTNPLPMQNVHQEHRADFLRYLENGRYFE